VRLIGGESYWPYGACHLAKIIRRANSISPGWRCCLRTAPHPTHGSTRCRRSPISTLDLATSVAIRAGRWLRIAALAHCRWPPGLYAGTAKGAKKPVPKQAFYQPHHRVIPAAGNHPTSPAPL